MSTFFDIGKTFIETKMVDTCWIRRDIPGVLDDTLNTTTGLLEPPEDDDSTIYQGTCLIKAQSTKDMSYEKGSQAVFRKSYEVMLPQDAPHVELGDVFVVVTSVNDATLDGKEFRVTENRYSTHATYRFLRVEDIQTDYNSTNPTS